MILFFFEEKKTERVLNLSCQISWRRESQGAKITERTVLLEEKALLNQEPMFHHSTFYQRPGVSFTHHAGAINVQLPNQYSMDRVSNNCLQSTSSAKLSVQQER